MLLPPADLCCSRWVRDWALLFLYRLQATVVLLVSSPQLVQLALDTLLVKDHTVRVCLELDTLAVRTVKLMALLLQQFALKSAPL